MNATNSHLSTTPKGLMFGIVKEACCRHIYVNDGSGTPTTGVGHTDKAGTVPLRDLEYPLSNEAMIDLLRKDLEKTEARVRKAFTRELAPHQFDAAVWFDFNTGGIFTASWVKRFNEYNDEAAYDAIMLWNKVTSNGIKVVSNGLVKRRTMERDLFFRGEYGQIDYAWLFPVNSARHTTHKGKTKLYNYELFPDVDWDGDQVLEGPAMSDVPLPQVKPAQLAGGLSAVGATVLGGAAYTFWDQIKDFIAWVF